MIIRLLAVLFCIVLTSSCATNETKPVLAKPNKMPSTPEDFPKDLIKLIGTSHSRCDDSAIASKITKWTCAGYNQSYNSFIINWEVIAENGQFKSRYKLQPTSAWMYYKEGNEIDFYAKSYNLQNTQVLVAFDPSESGREIFIGVGPQAKQLMATADGILDKTHLSNTNETISKISGSYNCIDFATRAEAQLFFNRNGFSANYDPYNLDADNNGIPCESTGRVVSDTSKCPSGESWVAPYTRSNGSNVRGHCRKRR